MNYVWNNSFNIFRFKPLAYNFSLIPPSLQTLKNDCKKDKITKEILKTIPNI